VAIYEFRCGVCAQVKQVSAGINDIYPIPNCDNCTIIMDRVYQATPIHFKGTGWGGEHGSK
jgi:putative FmdB family regulatory protein